MPRNAAGTMSVPNTFTPGTVAASADVNENHTDAATEITDSDRRALFSAVVTDRTGTDGDTAQNVFDSATDTLTLAATTTYEFEALYWITRAAGTTSHTTGVLFGGTATFTSLAYMAQISNPDGNVLADTQQIMASAATEVVLTGASTDATENVLIRLRGIMRVNAAGTVIPQFKYSAAPGGAPTIKANSFFRARPIGANTVASHGAWD